SISDCSSGPCWAWSQSRTCCRWWTCRCWSAPDSAPCCRPASATRCRSPVRTSYAPPCGLRARVRAGPIDLLAAGVGPLALDHVGILLASRRHAKHDAALADAPLVHLRPLLGDAVPDQAADQSAERATGP